MDTLYILIGIGIAGVVLVAIFKPQWLKSALLGLGLLIGAGVVHAVLVRQRRFQELGATAETAGALARLTTRAEQLRTQSNMVANAAERDRELRDTQTELLIALKKAQEEGADKERIRNEIRLAFPDF